MYGNVTSENSSSRSGQDGPAPRYLQQFFLDRLQHLVALRREHGPRLKSGDSDLRLLDKAVYSTFCDCLDLGAGDEARAAVRLEQMGTRDHEVPEVGSN